jgi:lysophospholipase L1-like esterase
MRTYHSLSMVLLLATILSLGSVSPMAAQSTAAGEIRSLSAAADSTDQLWAAWEEDDGRDVEVYVSRRIGQKWLAPQPVQSRPQAWDRSPSVAVAGGVPWLAWSSAERSDPGVHRIYVSRWLEGRWTEPEAVPSGGVFSAACARCGNATEPNLAAAPDGSLWLAWVGFDGTDDEIYAQHWDGGSWSLPVRVSADDGDPALYDRQPRLAVGEDGRPWLVWTGHQSGVDDEIYASHWTGVRWTSEQMVSADDTAVDDSPAVALDAQGRPWVAWQGRVDDGTNTYLRILTSHQDAARFTWTGEEVASSPLSAPVDEVRPALSPDGGGRLHLTWIARGDEGLALAGTRRDGARWTEAKLIYDGLPGEDVDLLSPATGQPTLLWLDPASSASAPIGTEAVDGSGVPLSSVTEETAPLAQILAASFPNRHLAFGDSITWGLYPTEDPHYPYPATLQDIMNARVGGWTVINAGKPGEGTGQGTNRIKLEVQEYRPKYVLIMEGTNDVSREIPPAEVYDNLVFMIENARKNAEVDGVQIMVSTIIPRLDDKNDATTEMNDLAIRPAASKRQVPLCDQWQSFYDYGDWQSLYWDDKHPDQVGLDRLAETAYGCIVNYYPEIGPETTPPVTWIEPLPALSECGQVAVSWSGTDNESSVVDYDVQAQVNYGEWTDWLLGTTATSGVYPGGAYNDVLGFRVRGRDASGNQNDYSDPVYTQIDDTIPPYDAGVYGLPPAQTAPFTVRWWAMDACAGVASYDVEYRAGVDGTWRAWLNATPNSSATFDPDVPQYGQTYYFHVRARDAAGRLMAEWSDPMEAYTLLARYAVTGHVYNVRGEPVVGAALSFDPAALLVQPQSGGGYKAYLPDGGDYDVSAARDDRFGVLPPRVQVPIAENLGGLDFYLPPQDDVVTDGGFEAGSLAAWQAGGTISPSVITGAHTGDGTVRLGEGSALSQTLTLPEGLTNPTLSFLVCLDDDTDVSSTLQVELAGTAISLTQVVTAGGWTHVWLPLDEVSSGSTTLSFSTPDAAAMRLDEVSLGSALAGGSWRYLPFVVQDRVP